MTSTNYINSTANESRSTQEGSVAVLLASFVEIALCLLGTFGNSLTIIVVRRTKSLQVVSNFLLASLAFAELLVSAILVPMRASQHMALYHGTATVPETVIQITGFVGRVNIIASIFNLAAMSIDRYIALSHPMLYLSLVRFAKGRVCPVISLIWAFSIFVTSMPKFPGVSGKTFLIFFVAFVLIATLVIAAAYRRIFQIARKSMRRQKTSKFACKVVRLSLTTTLDQKLFRHFDEASSAQKDRQAYGQKKERKTAGTIAFVIGAFAFLVYPRIILILYHFAAPETVESGHARFWIRILLYSNSVVNPGLYAWRHKEFKREFRKILLKGWQYLSCRKWEYLKKASSNKTFSTSATLRNRESIERRDRSEENGNGDERDLELPAIKEEGNKSPAVGYPKSAN